MFALKLEVEGAAIATVLENGVANKIMSFGNYVYQGMAAGCQPLMGYNYGAKNYKRMKALIKSGIIVTSCIELGITICQVPM